MGMAEAYSITGAADDEYDGRYERLAAECGGKPVYQQSGGDGYVLYQPTDRSNWVVSSSSRITSCSYVGSIISSDGNGGSCAASPDGAGCAGRWRLVIQSISQPSLAVSAAEPRVPPCDDSCRPLGASAAAANNGVCEERGLAAAACHGDRSCGCADGTDGSDCAPLRPCA